MKLAILPDFIEEQWPSMDLVAEMLSHHLPRLEGGEIITPILRPKYFQLTNRIPGLGQSKFVRNADRLLNRYVLYPRFLKKNRQNADFFHICDHSYAHLVHGLPAERTGVYCHDLDAFQCILEPEKEPRPLWFRKITHRILRGMQKARWVFYTTEVIGNEIRQYGLIPSDRLIHTPNGISPEFTPKTQENERIDIPIPDNCPYLLHVGSCIPRKRIDLLLAIFAEVKRQQSGLYLLQIGGTFTQKHLRYIEEKGLSESIVQIRGISRELLAKAYRQCKLTLITSDAEGFGLPVIEALACGSMVLASDIPPLREVGAQMVEFLPVGDISGWSEKISQLLRCPEMAPSLPARLQQAAQFTWQKYAQTIANAYRQLESSSRT